ncbi:tRNA uridine(34) 5-carboxymethylaminomethyl modification radical SAM/GNAT enzyme Elp3 [Candidatus Peregrinibacteria bacterium CG_4_10_14_0_2_um_filter_43_11]|nr:MAG: tRNA uridine(34) 5-carboxymethylaminomethyl modification radical SAM/GNAT enzyme Elp3 [Candidatus Peregrinibacteria bacterium CG_4_10_14_0_2_um_filter_43_11]
MNIYSVRKSLIPLAKKIIQECVTVSDLNEDKLKKIRNKWTKKNGGILPKNLELIQAYAELLEKGKIENTPGVLEVIQKRKVRTLSGIANITVLTKDLGCPGQCIYCPAEKGMPKSYLSNEPAMMRAVRNEFSAYKQVKTRLNGLVAQGHDITKIDIRTAGGTWGAIPLWYQEEFLKGIFLGLNEGPGALTANFKFLISNFKLEDLIKQNETANCRCVGLWVETRPDWVNEEELKRLRSYGVTGIELGIQTTDDKVNAFCKRGHGLKESIEATKLCRDVGLKICYHLMPNLPTATLESDLKSGRDLFEMEGLRPDYLKVYPCVVIQQSPLAEMIKEDKEVHTAYTDEKLINVIAEIKGSVPEYCRIIRIIRDIPAESIMIGSKKSNLRQIMQRRGITCRCIRCREIQDLNFKIENSKLKIQNYKANEGEEVFISIEEPKLDKLIGLCRLRLPKKPNDGIFPELKNVALVRELHVYGRQKTLNEKKGMDSKTQHLGIGKQLMAEAEKIAKKAGYKKIAVIAAIGTREYYKKLGYELEGTYMMKKLAPAD